jgi:hypothetical protein
MCYLRCAIPGQRCRAFQLFIIMQMFTGSRVKRNATSRACSADLGLMLFILAGARFTGASPQLGRLTINPTVDRPTLQDNTSLPFRKGGPVPRPFDTTLVSISILSP